MESDPSTSISLLRQLRSPRAELAWQRFVELYAPLIFYWARQRGLDPDDAADLVQEVLADLVTRLQSFDYDPQRRFRGWLRTLVVNRAINLARRRQGAPETGHEAVLRLAAEEDDADLLSETQYLSQIALAALRLLRSEIGDAHWQAAWMQLVGGRKAGEVAEELGISRNVAYLAKSRVLALLRQELDGLLDLD